MAKTRNIIDSRMLVAFSMSRTTLERALEAIGGLNSTQFRILMMVHILSPKETSQLGIVKTLELRPNVVSHNLAAMEKAGLVQRFANPQDSRSRYVRITEAGEKQAARTNRALVKQLYKDWPTKDPKFRKILETVIQVCSLIDPYSPGNRETDQERKNGESAPASRVITTVELVSSRIERKLCEQMDASYAECRILNLLGESRNPIRMRDIAENLVMSGASTTRAADRLCARGWCQRLAASAEQKAIYLAPTAEGAKQIEKLDRTIVEIGNDHTWNNLSTTQKTAMRQMADIVIADIQRKKEAKLTAVLQELRPI